MQPSGSVVGNPGSDAALRAVQRVERRLEAVDPHRRGSIRTLLLRYTQLNEELNKTIAAQSDPQASPSARKRQSGVRGFTEPQQAGYSGQAVGAALYMIVESLLIRLECERASLYLANERTGDLQLAVNAGIGMHKPGRVSHPPLSTGLLSSVVGTGVAVNLPTVTLEDVADCPGPTRARNALIFPIRRDEFRPDSCFGAIVAINHRHGAEPFSVDSEVMLSQMVPCIATLAKQYPIDYGVCAFDFAPLHRIVPLESYQAMSMRLPAGWRVPQQQLVYHREGPEKYVRREQPAAGAESSSGGGALEDVAVHLRTVNEYVESVRSCWRSAVEQQMTTESSVRQKQALITDAQEILHRKQEKLRHIKDALCERFDEAAADELDAVADAQAARGAGRAPSEQTQQPDPQGAE